MADVGVREWAALATLDAIGLGEELGMRWDEEAGSFARLWCSALRKGPASDVVRE